MYSKYFNLILVSFISVFMITACNFPVSVEKNDTSEAKKNARMVKQIIDDQYINEVDIYVNGDFEDATKVFEVRDIYFVNLEEDNFRKYNLGKLIYAERIDNELQLGF